MTTVYTTIVDNDTIYSGPSLEQAIRHCNNAAGRSVLIDFAEYDPVRRTGRSGYILYADDDGVYLNPWIANQVRHKEDTQ